MKKKSRTDPFTPEKRSAVMRAVPRKDTTPETMLRREIWKLGLRYRKHRKVEGTHPDICFVGKKLAVFVDGCFWHGCPDHYTAPKARADFWRTKVERNHARDREYDRRLKTAGWTVLRYWECRVKKDASTIAHEVDEVLRGLASYDLRPAKSAPQDAGAPAG